MFRSYISLIVHRNYEYIRLVFIKGTDHGLRLTINVEQYEYMHGPHDSAGLKILLYDPAEEPLVYELGQAVATGTHTYVGVKVIQVRSRS